MTIVDGVAGYGGVPCKPYLGPAARDGYGPRTSARYASAHIGARLRQRRPSGRGAPLAGAWEADAMQAPSSNVLFIGPPVERSRRAIPRARVSSGSSGSRGHGETERRDSRLGEPGPATHRRQMPGRRDPSRVEWRSPGIRTRPLPARSLRTRSLEGADTPRRPLRNRVVARVRLRVRRPGRRPRPG